DREVFARSFVPSTVTRPSFTRPAARPSRSVSRRIHAKSSRWRTRKRLIVRKSGTARSEEHTSELQSRFDIVCRLLLENKKMTRIESEHGPKSVITRPSGGQQLPPNGYYEITRLAWPGGG